MQLTRLSLTNFRSYPKFDYEFGPRVILVGPNGIGKTNVLEAIYLLAVLKSYRAVSDSEVIRFGTEFAKIKGIAKVRPGPKSKSDVIELVIHQGHKRAKKNGVAKPLSHLIGTIKTVFFSPDQLDIIVGPPRRRRRFLDALLCQIDQRYTAHLLSYQKAIRQRNALLISIRQGGAQARELYFWDRQLLEYSAPLSQRRSQLLAFINRELPSLYQKIATDRTPLALAPRFSPLSPELLQANLAHDIAIGATTAGPHRDNFVLELSGRELGPYGSRGEWRSALLALKLAEIDVVRTETGIDPILLLDDVFSELDRSRREHLLLSLPSGQTFLTTTDLALVSPELVDSSQIVEVKKNAAALR